MSYYNSTPITQLTPGTASKITDVFAAVDTTDTTQSPSGTTKKYTLAQIQNYLNIFEWELVTDNTKTMEINHGYITDNSVIPVAFTLPTVAPVGSIIQVAGMSPGLYTIAQNAGQQILFGSQMTTLGVAGSLAAILSTDYVQLVCVRANVLFSVIGVQNALTVI